MSKRTVLVLLALAGVAALCAAQDTSLAVEKIVVTATRIAGTILASPDHITVVSGEELAGALSAAEALHSVAGVSVSDNGTSGSVQSVSVRGSTSAQVLVLLDGVRLNDSRQGGADLSQIPVDNIDRIEIVRGGISALYGADAVAGVVNIITKDKAEDRFRLSITNGGYLPRNAVRVDEGTGEQSAPADLLDLVDTQKLHLQLASPLSGMELLATGSFTRASNAFVWYDGQYIDKYRKRINAALLEGDASLSLTGLVGSGRIGLKGQFGYSSGQVPGTINTSPFALSTDASQQNTLLNSQAFYSAPQLGASLLSLDVRLFYKYSRLDFQEPTPTFGSPVDDSHVLHSLGLEVFQKLAASDWLELVYGGNLLFDEVVSTSIGNPNRISGGVFLEAPAYLLSWLTLTPTVRYDLYSDFPGSLTFKLAAVLALSQSVSLKGSVARSYRAPTLNDLYWPNDGFSSGNPDLRSETGFGGEVGVSLVGERLQLNLFAFARYLQDAIQWMDTDPDVVLEFYQPVNVGQALYPGAEADLSFQLLPGLRIAGGYTFLYSFVLKGATATFSFADDKRAIYSPVHKADLTVTFRTARTLLGVDAEYVSESFANEANTTRLAPYLVLNAEVRQGLNDRLSLTVAGKNLLNQVYQTVNGYIMPPLSFWVGAELTL